MDQTPPDGAGSLASDTVLWAALTSDPAIGVAVLDADGVFRFANARFAHFFGIGDAERVVGSPFGEHFPREVVEEWAPVAQRVLSTRRPLLVRRVYQGRQLQCTLWPAPAREQGDDAILVVTHRGEHDPVTDDMEILEASVVDLGPLDALSKRELEVLALLGEGLTLDQVAARLHRSRKTIDNHRQSIVRKLGESSRVRLAQIAGEAGLRITDAALPRTRREAREN